MEEIFQPSDLPVRSQRDARVHGHGSGGRSPAETDARPYPGPSANEAVEYIPQVRFRAALFNNTPYMGYPTDETDELWSDLYNYMKDEEAKKLPSPTLPIPGTKDHLIELDVWHELPCLNDLRMLLYPERFPGLDVLKDENGVINRDTDAFRHWGSCYS
ncbi:hypothetical protein VTN77DRAFT_8598 [Rasamsonia byssochlamydoides]|uniref:uncharacterized protein n=1 Tax=Rasamsonia byssochlamydoides TaxID=89139 RepID=UPI003742B472